MEQNNIIECAGFYFIHNFDSGNLGHVERVPTELIAPGTNPRTNAIETPDYEFNLWTRPDCAGTEFENGNRTWFYFGIQASEPAVLVRLNIINLNKQGKMYNQGMAPVTRTLPGKPQWERIRDKPVHSTDDNTFTLSFKYRTSENVKATTFFAFTYPYSYAELQMALNCIDMKMLPLPANPELDDIYYYRECLVYSLEGRRVDLLTISSHHGISTEREDRLKSLFPEHLERPFKFPNKKIIFISARVHPGETPSSFVFNGFLNLLLTRNDPLAIQLRKLYVFKMIPFLNPDGVARGHYRTDTRGVNLNRVYLNPSYLYHPTVYASRALIRYYHYGFEKEDNCEDSRSFISRSIQNDCEISDLVEIKKKKPASQMLAKSKEILKREKLGKPTADKSTTNLRENDNRSISVNTVTGDSVIGQVAGQVNDMKLHEQNSQTTDNFTSEESASLLNDNILKSCLGSDVHLSTSEELRFEGRNPLRPLRDTLKDSISLLMGSADKASPDPSTANLGSSAAVAMGWCRDCKRALAALEETMPGIAQSIPHNINTSVSSPRTCRSIEEYRQQQRKQVDDQERESKRIQDQSKRGTMYFCTNCFKRYLVTETNEEIKVSEPAAQPLRGNSGEAGDSPLVNQAPTPTQSQSKIQLKPPKSAPYKKKSKESTPPPSLTKGPPKEPESGLYLYIDLHGHASKKGIFMYGNHFEDIESSVECMLLPRIMSLNNLHFHFSSCNFTERNMYLKDRRDGMSREGSGRVAVLKATGLVRSYTLECNYNTGRLVNVLPPGVRDPPAPPAAAPAPPKYTPHIYEEVGRSLGASILDLTCAHPNSRIPNSEHRNLATIRDWLRAHTRSMKAQLTTSRLRPNVTSPVRAPLFPRTSKSKTTDDRKENAYSRADERPSPPRARSDKFGKRAEKPEPKASRRCPDEPRTKSMASKRRNVLGVRKPNASKTLLPRSKSRRGTDDSDPRAKAKRLRRNVPRALASSSSEEAAWPPDALKRRSFAAPAPPLLKKIRLKTAL